MMTILKKNLLSMRGSSMAIMNKKDEGWREEVRAEEQDSQLF
jgi:hypothetical protein